MKRRKTNTKAWRIGGVSHNLRRWWWWFFFSCGSSTRFRTIEIPEGVSLSHSVDTPQSVGPLWASDQFDAETSSWQHTTQQTFMPSAGFEATILAYKRPADPRLRTRGHWDRQRWFQTWNYDHITNGETGHTIEFLPRRLLTLFQQRKWIK